MTDKDKHEEFNDIKVLLENCTLVGKLENIRVIDKYKTYPEVQHILTTKGMFESFSKEVVFGPRGYVNIYPPDEDKDKKLKNAETDITKLVEDHLGIKGFETKAYLCLWDKDCIQIDGDLNLEQLKVLVRLLEALQK